jgi:PTS system cellobiose-specific IIC component
VLDSIWLTAQIANMNAFMKGEALPFVGPETPLICTHGSAAPAVPYCS